MTLAEPWIREPYLDPSRSEILQALSKPLRALFLDRDGVINVDHGYVCSERRTQFIEPTIRLIAEASAEGFVPIVVTNQAGIARGLYDEVDFRRYTGWVHAHFQALGTPLLATYFCPHHPSAGPSALTVDCSCRKPRPGMFIKACTDFGIDMAASRMVGDKVSDIQAAISAGLDPANCMLVGDAASG